MSLSFRVLEGHEPDTERDQSFEEYVRQEIIRYGQEGQKLTELSYGFGERSLQLEVTPGLQDIPVLRSLCFWYLQEVQIPEELASNLVLAFEEAIANILRHSYQEGNIPWVRVVMAVESNSLSLRFEDRGEGGRNPGLVEALEAISQEGRPRLRRRGGLGLYLMKRMMTEMTYKPGEPVNCLLLRKDWESTSTS